MTKILFIALFVVFSVQTAVVPFDEKVAEQIFQNKKSALFLFTNGNEASSSAQQSFSVYQTRNSGLLILTHSDKNDVDGFYNGLAKRFGINPENAPTILFFSQKGNKYLFEQQQITPETISSFVGKVKAGSINRFLKSAQPPIESTSHVKVLVGKTFEELVLKTQKQILVKFYQPECGNCKTLAPHYDEAAQRLSNNPKILIANFDLTQNQVADLQITETPSLKFWRKDKTLPPIEYNGESTADGIIQWLKEHTEYEWVAQAADNGEQL